MESLQSQEKGRRGLWLIGGVLGAMLFLTVGCCVMMIIAIAPTMHQTRDNARKTRCGDNLRKIGIALEHYYQANNGYPPVITDNTDGSQTSWRSLLTHYLSEPFGGPPYDKPHYQCPAAETAGEGLTYYLAVTGDKTPWRPNHSTTKDEIEDGLTNTIAIVEYADSTISWNEPRDLNFDRLNLQLNSGQSSLGSHHKDGCHILLFDGSVHFIANGFDESTLRKMLQHSDGETLEDWRPR